MKEKIEKLKTWVKENKKRAAGIVIGVLLLIGAVGIGVATMLPPETEKPIAKTDTSKEEVAKKDDKSAKDKADQKSDKEKKDEEDDQKSDAKSEKKTDEKKTDDKKSDTKSEDKATTADNTQKPSGTNNAGSSGNNTGSGNTGSNTQQPSKPQTPVHTHSFNTPVYGTTQKKVVDQQGWTETVNEPIYEMQPVWFCNTCGADITANPGGHLDETMHAGYWNDWQQVQTGTNTYTIEHPEQWHWENEQIVTGYQCSCGAVQ